MLYKSRPHDAIECLGDKYQPPKEFVHGEWTLVATLTKDKDSDGHSVKIYECRMPAKFFKIKALPSRNSMEETQKGFTLTTGTIDKELVGKMALEICDGCLALAEEEVTDKNSLTKAIKETPSGSLFCPMCDSFDCRCHGC